MRVDAAEVHPAVELAATGRAACHASAVLASNCLVALEAAAVGDAQDPEGFVLSGQKCAVLDGEGELVAILTRADIVSALAAASDDEDLFA